MTTTLVQVGEGKYVRLEHILSVEQSGLSYAEAKIRLIDGVEIATTWGVLDVVVAIRQSASQPQPAG